MTATSGPGISLYSENIGAAIMLETPLVIVDVQRMGPATGAQPPWRKAMCSSCAGGPRAATR